MDINQVEKILFRHLLGRLTEEDSFRLDGWKQESVENRALMERLTSKFFLEKAIGDRNKGLRTKEWEKLEKLTLTKRLRMIRLRWLKIAVAILLPLASSFLVWQQRVPESEGKEQISKGSSKAIVELAGGQQIYLSHDTILNFENKKVCLVNYMDTLNLFSQNVIASDTADFYVIRVPRGGEYIARLEDGTVVNLNAGSELKVPVSFGKQTRNVLLKGEAFFNVAHDENTVFTVHTDKAKISVLGTEFDVRAYEDEQEVVTTLVNGAIEIQSGSESNRLTPGEQAEVIKKGKISVRKVNVYPYMAWIKGRMVFENERLDKIMTDLQRWYDFEIFYTNPDIKELRFTMDIMKYDDISKVLKLMQKMNKVTIMQKGRTLVLSRR